MQDPITRELVLVGGGHAHLGVLRASARWLLPSGTRLTLVAREAEPLYSGMLPGLIAGRFEPEKCVIDLMRLARATGARFVRAQACGLDRANNLLLLEDRPPLHFDLLSFNTGAVPTLVPGAAEHTLVLRPFDRFLPAWRALLKRAETTRRPLDLVVVGEGAAGVEVALALRQRLGPAGDVALVAQGRQPLPGMAPAARRLAARALGRHDVGFHAEAAVVRVEPGALVTEAGRIRFDAAIWATGAAPPPWLKRTGLVLCPQGFIAVEASLRAVGERHVFAAGDVASVLPHPRPRAGVFAVRQGPPLAANLRRVLAGKEPRPYRPQDRYLALIGIDAENAIAVRGRFAAQGRWARRLKDRIDRRWIRIHAEMTVMPPTDAAAMRCGAKLPASVLGRVLARLELGPEAGDDAVLLEPLRPGRQLVQTVDFFRAALDDPYLQGRVAANHALGDIAAMGAEASCALALVCLPPAAEPVLEAELFALLRGGQEVLEAAGARLIGGHSAEGAEAALGFAVTGEVPQGRALRRVGLQPGDRLILTKPLGTGAVLAAAMQGRAPAAWVEATIGAMQVSPLPAARVLRAHGATACCDVTGFGLLNHLLEMLRASGEVAAILDPEPVPALPGALDVLTSGVRSTLHPANASAATSWLDGVEQVPAERLALLLDPQTAGGLLAGVPAARAAACLAALQTAGYEAALIGEVRAGRPVIHLEPGIVARVERTTPLPTEVTGSHADRRGHHPGRPGKPLPTADR